MATSQIDFVEAKLFADSSRENSEFKSEEVEKYRSKLFLFRARLSLLHGNVKNCKKEIKGYSNAAGNVSWLGSVVAGHTHTFLQNACAVLLKANVEYLKQNYHKCLKVLSSAPKPPIDTETGECLGAFFFNNMACNHFHLARYHLGAYYLAKAIEENDSALNGFPPLDRGKFSCCCSMLTVSMLSSSHTPLRTATQCAGSELSAHSALQSWSAAAVCWAAFASI